VLKLSLSHAYISSRNEYSCETGALDVCNAMAVLKQLLLLHARQSGTLQYMHHHVLLGREW
jgi:hypothetical protein